MIINFIYKIIAKVTERIMYHYGKVNVIRERCIRKILLNDIISMLPQKSIELIDYTILRRFITHYSTNLLYCHKLNKETIKFALCYNPFSIRFIACPDSDLEMCAVWSSGAAIYMIENPSDETIIYFLKNHWNPVDYKCITDKFDINNNLRKEINKLKIKLGPLEGHYAT